MMRFLQKPLVVVALGVMIAAQIISPIKASALDADTENFYSINDIGFYDPTACKANSAVVAVQLSGKDSVEKILSFFMQKGLTLAQASGFVGNMQQESGLNPAIEQGGRVVDDTYTPKNGVGFGLVQWTFSGRQQPLVDFVHQMGVGITDMGGQLGYVWQELTTTYQPALSALKATDNPVDAAIAIHDKYEVSADSADTVRQVRGGTAQKVYDTYKDAPPLIVSPPGGSGGSGSGGNSADLVSATSNSKQAKQCDYSFGGGNLSQTVLAYAWHDYKGLTTEATEAYKTAIDRARSQNHYVGSTTYPGIDCGGFVTTLMIDSGQEPNYNYGGALPKAGNTLIQEKWLLENWELRPADNAGDRVPGDVAINNAHTYVYVGDIPGFNSKVASASLNERAPMAGQESLADTSFHWYRQKHTTSTSGLDKKV
jgi:hypothetical protein